MPRSSAENQDYVSFPLVLVDALGKAEVGGAPGHVEQAAVLGHPSRHPHTASIFDYGVTEDVTPFYAMERFGEP